LGEEPTAAWILSLIGGILGLLGYLLVLGLALASLGAAAAEAEQYNAEVPGLGLAGGALAALCGWFVIAHIIIIIGALKIKSGEPSSVRTGGILVLIFSILGGGNILALIGGILALTWKPPKRIEAVPAPPPPPPT